ncbi:hypothetical protein G3O08_06595 [Cryomorpha ignava]|uniref:Uncharacterized protein n=1 Tax=Cryomorpha ignava TaxID=101383 RepID=A0A7K3WNF9_9FLAO|nr:hypothetical protein [Cryomorpha ignava]NEN23166.1 hypothetical protein [Cryomorpha ignava]
MRKLNTYLLIFTILVSVILVAPTGLSAQRDTTGTAAKTDSIIEYLTPLEYAFMMHEETKFMLRAPAVGVGAEVELLPYFTLMGQLELRSSQISSPSYFTLNAELRLYYSSKKKGVRNMSGNYFALGYDNPTIPNEQNEQYYYGRWGIQRRFLGNGLIDFGINAGYSTYRKLNRFTDNTYSRDAIFIQSTALVGLGLVFGNEKALDRDRLCPVVKCYKKETLLLKINTTDLFSVYKATTERYDEIRIRPKIAIEQKLFDLPVSIGADFGLEYYSRTSSKENPYSRNGRSSQFTARLQARYYYNLKNRIRKGKCGDGLSANYISYGYNRNYEFYNDSFRSGGSGYTISTGIQRTFSDHFYFDVEMGYQNGSNPYNNNIDFNLFGDIQLGIKF